MDGTKAPDVGSSPIENPGGSIPKVDALRPEDTFIKAVEGAPDSHAGIEMVSHAEFQADPALSRAISDEDNKKILGEKADDDLSTDAPDTEMGAKLQSAQLQKDKRELGISNKPLTPPQMRYLAAERDDVGINNPIQPEDTHDAIMEAANVPEASGSTPPPTPTGETAGAAPPPSDTSSAKEPEQYPGPYGKMITRVDVPDGTYNKGGPPVTPGEQRPSQPEKPAANPNLGGPPIFKDEPPVDEAEARRRAAETAPVTPPINVDLPEPEPEKPAANPNLEKTSEELPDFRNRRADGGKTVDQQLADGDIDREEAQKRAAETAPIIPPIEVSLPEPGEEPEATPFDTPPLDQRLESDVKFYNEIISENDAALAQLRETTGEKMFARGDPNPMSDRGERFKSPAEAEEYRRNQIANLVDEGKRSRAERNDAQRKLEEYKAAQPPEDKAQADAKKQEEIASLETKLADRSINDEEYTRLQELKKDPDDEYKKLDALVKSGNATPEQLAEWRKGPQEKGVDNRTPDEIAADKALAEEEKKKQDVDKAYQEWVRLGAEGSAKSGDALAEWIKKDAEARGEPLSSNELSKLKQDAKEMYKNISPESKRATEIRKKFIELGQIEAQLVAREALVKSMKESADKMKDQVNSLQDSYMAEKDPQERMRKLQLWRTQALRLEGYQISINDQAAEGRRTRIKRRHIVGQIHLALGTKGRLGRIGFGLETAFHEAADVFLDVTVDAARDLKNKIA